jgi:hypothetical protein
MHRFAERITLRGKTGRTHTKWHQLPSRMQTATISLVLACALLTSSTSRAEVVYTTANAVGAASSANTQSPSLSGGYKIGTFGSSSTPSFSFTKEKGSTQLPGIQFTTSNFDDTHQLTGVNINLFVKGSGGGSNTIQGGTLKWDLYKVGATSTDKVASFTSALTAMSYTGNGFSTNQYQSSPFQLVGTGSTDELLKETRYTLLLQSIDNLTTSNSAKDASLYWTYFNGTPAGGSYALNKEGFVTSPYSAGSTFSSRDLAFDINIRAAPEPGTLLLGFIASSAGGGAVWWKRRKKPLPQTSEEESDANAPA